ncbi:MAG: VPLPA-CTERM sorting domain-containing protein [Pseudomonadota bacterium]|nr:VPLPA-CTERM sorting domain-containing protein [Pseudomonadota bacterium]
MKMKKKTSHKVSIAVIGVIAMFLSLVPVTAMAGTFTPAMLDNLSFLYAGNGSTVVSGSTKNAGVFDVTGNPFAGQAGDVDVVYLGSEAGYNNKLKHQPSFSYKTVFNNSSNSFGYKSTLDIDTAYFKTLGGDSDWINWYDGDTRKNQSDLGIKIFKLSGSLLSEYTLSTGIFNDDYNYYVYGFGDGGGLPVDNDFDDLVVAVRGNAVPIPSAVWLLGSGLLGMVAIRRKKRA